MALDERLRRARSELHDKFDTIEPPPFEGVSRPAPQPRRRSPVLVGALAALVMVVVVGAVALSGFFSGEGRDVATGTTAPSSGWVLADLGQGWETIDPSAFLIEEGGEGEPGIQSLAVGGPGLVAAGWICHPDGCPSTIWTSPDGTSWSEVPDARSVFGAAASISDIESTEFGLIAVGSTCTEQPDAAETCRAAAWTSPDGLTWYLVPNQAEMFPTVAGPEWKDFVNIQQVTAGPMGVIALASRPSTPVLPGPHVGVILFSADGQEWVRIAENPAVFGADAIFYDALAVGSEIVVVGRECETPGGCVQVLWETDNGTTWRRAGQFDFLGFSDLTAFSGGLVAVGEAADERPTAWFSQDGLVWQEATMEGADVAPSGLSTVAPVSNALLAFSYPYFGGPGDDPTLDGVTLWTSLDGQTWTRLPQNPPALQGMVADAVVYNDRIIAGGQAGGLGPLWIWTPPEG